MLSTTRGELFVLLRDDALRIAQGRRQKLHLLKTKCIGCRWRLRARLRITAVLGSRALSTVHSQLMSREGNHVGLALLRVFQGARTF